MALGGPRWPSVVLGGHQDQDKSRWPHCHLRSHPGEGRRVLSALGGLGDVEVCGGPQDEVASMGTGWWDHWGHGDVHVLLCVVATGTRGHPCTGTWGRDGGHVCAVTMGWAMSGHEQCHGDG